MTMVGKCREMARDERGSIVAFVALIPALVLILAVIVQLAIIGHVRHQATAAAEAGLVLTAAYDGSSAEGLARMSDGMSSGGWVESVGFDATRGGEVASVRVEAEALQLLPFGNTTIVIERDAQVERAGG